MFQNIYTVYINILFHCHLSKILFDVPGSNFTPHSPSELTPGLLEPSLMPTVSSVFSCLIGLVMVFLSSRTLSWKKKNDVVNQ